MNRFRNLALSTALALGMGLSGGSAFADVAIGVAGPLTGPNAAFGEQMRRGAEMAVADINAAGGVNGEMLTVEFGDDASDPRQGVAAANDLVGKGVVFVAGHFNSSVSIPASQIYAEEGILQITPASTNPQLTEQGFDTVFRTCGRDDQQGDVAGAYIAENFAGKNIAILHDNTTYGKGLADATKAKMNELGLTEVLYEAVTVGERDYSAVVSKLKQAAVDAIYFGGLHNEAGLLVRQSREQGLEAVLISGDGIVTQEFWAITGDAGQGTLMTFGADQRESDAAKDVVARFRAENYEPEGYTLYTYAAIQIWAAAANKAGTTDAAEVAAALKDGTEYPSVLGALSFDEKGDREQADYVFYVWKDGTYAQM
jgi:branched-chain amino acid transport system substrate-binding protein